MRKSVIYSKFNPDISETELRLLDNFNSAESRITRQTEKIKEFEKFLLSKNNELNQRFVDLDIKVNNSIFGDRKFLNESYALEVPIQPEYFIENSSITFKDGILTTGIKIEQSSETIPLGIEHITSKKGTKFKFINKILTIEENELYSYQEIALTVPEYIKSGYLVFEVDKSVSVSVHSNLGKELIPKQVTSKVVYPVSRDSKIVIRFNTNNKKTLKLLNFFVSKEEFRKSSEVITKPINFKRKVSQLGIYTCDNYSEEDINISYSVSLNGGDFKTIRPLNKQKNLDLKSIITAETKTENYKLTKHIRNEIQDYFLIEDFDYRDFLLIDSFEYKLGDTIGFVDTSKTIFVDVEESFDLMIPSQESVYLNNKQVTGKVTLSRGLNELKVSLQAWNQKHNVLEYEILGYKEGIVKYRDKNFRVFTTNVGDSIFYQLYNKPIYTNKLDSNLFFYEDRVYISKGFEKQAYVFIKNNKVLIETITIRIHLESNRPNIPPYISSLIIKAI